MNPRLITITIGGKLFSVPAGMSAIQATWYCGIDLTHGIGCLGGVCGACTMTYRLGDSPVKTALACQTMILDGMSFNLYQPETKRSVPYKSRLDRAKGEDPANLKTHFNETLSSTRRCVSCGACTQVCPQEIDAMKGVKEAINSNFKTVSDLFLNCVMCGLCASVCEVQVHPHLVGLYGRNATAIYLTPVSQQLSMRIEEIKSGRYDAEWESMDKMSVSDWAGVG
jgi:succinate dehydrogenase/fumarate reductase-like Fe-S protein